MRTFIYPYNAASKSAAEVAKAMEVKRLKLVNSKVRDADNLVVINWGAGSVPYLKAKIVNNPKAVTVSANKLKCFEALKKGGVSIPNFTTDIEVAKTWIANKQKVAVRKLLNATGGKGLSIAKTVAELEKAPLYVQYIPKLAEFRVHVIDGKVVRVQRKVWPKRKEEKPEQWEIRNHEHGFIFQNIEAKDIPNHSVLKQSVDAVDVLGLDFGGVDVIWNGNQAKAFVLEVNTAPGVEGETTNIYANNLKDLIRRRFV